MRAISCICILASALLAQTQERPVRSVTDPGVVTTRQAITPAGVPTVFQGRVYGVTFGRNASEIWVLTQTRVYRLDWKTNRILDNVALGGSAGLQGIRYDAPTDRALVSGAVNDSSNAARVRLAAVRDGKLDPLATSLGTYLAGGLAVAAEPNGKGRRLMVVPLVRDNRLAILDASAGQLLGSVPTGIAPFAAVIDKTSSIAYVTNWGGRVATEKDLTAPTGVAADADKVVVNNSGIASTGTVTRVDLASMTATHTIAVELHPTGIVWDESHARLYVANGNRDSVSVIDTRRNAVIATWPVQPFERKVTGIAPSAVAVAQDGRTLFVACGGINAVAMLDTANGALRGMIPAAWYPNTLSLSPDGTYLAIGSLLGPGSGWRDEPRKRFVHANRGSVNVVEVPGDAQLASYTTAVAENNRMRLHGTPVAERKPSKTVPTAIPERAGEPSLIEHVVYIVKENRTYDQVFGDIAKANGDPDLVMFGEPVTTNQHRLAETFGVLDNFYATGGNSADGHQWVTQANETDYCLWPGYAGRSYPFDGTDPIAYAQGGFLWDAALRVGKTVRIYGEYAGHELHAPDRSALLERWKTGADFASDWNTVAPIAPLNRILAAQYPSYTTSIPDVVRARIFLADLKRWSRAGKMPNLVIVQLPSNHTNGTRPGSSSAKAMVADNDLALGQMVEGLSHSPFWTKMAIFVVEDDAQNGVDHVDGHRTVALTISPYSRRGQVDSTFYSHQSILKTIELILGLPTLSLFDLIANDMRASFSDTPDITPYSAVAPAQSLFELNPPATALRGEARKAALASAKMRWDIPDAAPTEKLNRILWHQAKGWSTPYPAIHHAVFAPLAVDVDDDDR